MMTWQQADAGSPADVTEPHCAPTCFDPRHRSFPWPDPGPPQRLVPPVVNHDALVRAFADYAHALRSHYDVGTVLYRLTDHVVDVLQADGAGVSLARDEHHLAFVAATDGHVAAIEEQQIATGTGPCHDAFRTGEVVAVTDLATEDRWPEYTQAARNAGAAAVLGVPMPVDQRRIGAVNIYKHTAHDWAEHEITVAAVLADMATGYILNAGELEEARTLAQQLQHALDSRIIIEQAKGILAERNQITPAEAFQRLRKYARHTQTRLHDVAAQVVDGTPTL